MESAGTRDLEALVDLLGHFLRLLDKTCDHWLAGRTTLAAQEASGAPNARDAILQAVKQSLPVLVPPMNVTSLQFGAQLRANVESAAHLCRFVHCIHVDRVESDPDFERIRKEMWERLPALRNSIWEACRHIQHVMDCVEGENGRLGVRHDLALLTPVIDGVRDSLEQARLDDLASNMIVVGTAGDLWKAYLEGKRPCFETSGISLRPGGNTPNITCTDNASEAKRNALGRAIALVTVEGGEKAAAMEKLIARVQLQTDMDKASVINLPLADFVAAVMGQSNAQSLTGAAKADDAVGKVSEANAKHACPSDVQSTATPKGRGRKKADYETVQKEAALAAEWERARDAGIYKTDFAKDKSMMVKELDNLLDRVAKRKLASE